MSKQSERRRYFRITDTVGIAYQLMDNAVWSEASQRKVPNVLEQVADHDKKIQSLLVEVKQSHPKIAELVAEFNQKFERVVNQLMTDSHLVSRIAEKVREVNISACGIAFQDDEYLKQNTALKMEITLYPSNQKVEAEGRVVSCDAVEDGDGYYLRIDFYSMSDAHQELLIQHIVRSQSNQRRAERK